MSKRTQKGQEIKYLVGIIAIWILFCLIAYALNCFIQYSDGDDAYFYTSAHDMGFIEYLKMRYQSWTGRLTSEAMTYLNFSQEQGVWQVINAIFFTLLPMGLARIVLKIFPEDLCWKKIFFMSMLACISLTLIEMSVLGYAVFWMTGSVYYLWSITIGIWAVMPFVDLVFSKERLCSKISFLYAIPCGIIACLALEQIGAIIIVFGVFAIIFHLFETKRGILLPCIQLGLMIISFLILFAAPGNAVRTEVEIVKWMPEFQGLSLGQHIFISFQWLISSFANESKMIFIILWILLGCILLEESGKKKYFGYGAFLFAIVGSASFFGITTFSNMGIGIQDITQTVTTVPVITNLTGSNILAIIWWSVAGFYTLLLMWMPKNQIHIKVTMILMYLAGIASSAIMYFSPTMYASGGRIFFMMNLMFLLIILSFAQRIDRGKATILLVLVILVGGIVQFLTGYSYMMGFLG